MAAQLEYVKISPCGNVVRCQFNNGPGVPTDITSVTAAGATLNINGTPLALTLPYWPLATEHGDQAGSWVQYNLGADIYEIAIGEAGPGYTETGAGWTSTTGVEPGFAQGGSYRRTLDGNATVRYSPAPFFPGGRYQLYANLRYICGVAGRTPDAVYTILDNDGTTVLQTVHVDQTSQALTYDATDTGLHLTKIGVPFNTNVAGSGFTVVVSNGAGVPFGPFVDDTFQRADSATVGNGWVPSHAGIWAISSNTLVATADGDANPIGDGYDLLRPSGEDGLNQSVSATVPIAGTITGNNWHAACVLRCNRTTHDKYFAFLTDNAIVIALISGGTTSIPTGGVHGMGALVIGHPVRLDFTATGSAPTTLTATCTDLATGSVLGTNILTDSSSTLQAAGGMGVGFDGGVIGDKTIYTEVAATNLGAGGGSTLVADMIYVRTAKPRTVPLGATVTLSADAGTYVTHAGTIGAITAFPASLTTDMSPTPALSWLPHFDPTAPHPMKVGYNLAFPGSASLPQKFYFNRALEGTGWTAVPPGAGGANVPADVNTGVLTGPVTGGHAQAVFVSNITNSMDSYGWITAPVAPTRWRYEFDFTLNGEGDGRPAGIGFSGDGTFSNPAGPTLISGNRWFYEADVAPNTVPNPAAWPGFVPNYGGQVFYTTISQISNISITDVGNHRGWPHATEPGLYDYLHGRFTGGDLRFLDSIPINAGSAVNASDLAPATGRFCSAFGAYHTFATVTKIEPVDVTTADTDNAQKWFHSQTNLAAVKVTTATAHGLTTGHRPRWDMGNYPGGAGVTFPSSTGGNIRFNGFASGGSYFVVVLNGTQFISQCTHDQAGTGNAGAPDPPFTLAGPHDMTVGGPDQPVRVIGQADAGEPVEDLIAAAIEVGMVPWINVPITLTAAGFAAMAARVEAAMPLGQVFRLEFYNEPWNDTVTPQQWFDMLVTNFQYNNRHSIANPPNASGIGGVGQCYAFLADLCFKAFRAAWASAGRPVTEVIRVINVQRGNPSDGQASTLTMLGQFYATDIAEGNPCGFDEIAEACYQQPFAPDYSGNIMTVGGVNQTFDHMRKLDDEGTISAAGALTTDTGRKTLVQRQRDALNGTIVRQQSPFDLVPGQTWAGTGHFTNVGHINYEGGWDDMNLRNRLNNAINGSDSNWPEGSGRTLVGTRSIIKHPRMYWLELARLQSNEEAGIQRHCRFTLTTIQFQGPAQWYDFSSYGQGVGTGDPSENVNPLDEPRVVSQIGGAMRTFAALSLSPATTYTLATAGTGMVGTPQTVTISPNGPFTGTITLSATRGTLATSSFTFASAAPQTTTYTPTSAGTGVITGTSGGALTDPSPASVTISAATPATLYTLTPSTATAAIGQARTFTLQPNGTFTGTITPHVTGSAVASPTSLTWTGDGSAKSFTVADSVAETVTISATNSGALTNPGNATLVVSASVRSSQRNKLNQRRALLAKHFSLPPRPAPVTFTTDTTKGGRL